ncbi:hypothetical protein [Vacuolonema iberomarrocanum]|uniref:hypothetical protein n=1 Tax=Vacuolonema iberomarrocanum TaxID=3454632 RepID=UPI003F6E077F
MISAIFEQFVEASPLSVMVRALMERIFSAEKLDELFEETAEQQYTRELLFSSVVGLMSLVVSGIHPSVHAAYKALENQIGVSKPALYGKLNGLEPKMSQALVRYSHRELAPVVSALGLSQGMQLPGYRICISIAVLDPEQLLVRDVFPCEDDHAQERSLLPEILDTVNAKDLWIADRNFCTRAALLGIDQRQGYFIIRAHQKLPWEALEPLTAVGASPTGAVFEQAVRISHDGHCLTGRRVVVKLAVPTVSSHHRCLLL